MKTKLVNFGVSCMAIGAGIICLFISNTWEMTALTVLGMLGASWAAREAGREIVNA